MSMLLGDIYSESHEYNLYNRRSQIRRILHINFTQIENYTTNVTNLSIYIHWARGIVLLDVSTYAASLSTVHITNQNKRSEINGWVWSK